MAGFLLTALAYLRPYWPHCVLVLLAQVPAVGFVTLQPLLLRSLIDDAILPGNARLAVLLIAAMIGLLAAHALGDLANHYLVARVGASVMNDLRLRIFRHLQSLSVSFYARSQTGDILSRFTSDLDAVERALTHELPAAIYYVLTIGVGALVLCAIEWRLALLILVLLPVVHFASRALGPRAEGASAVRQQDVARAVTAMHENLAAHLIVRAFGLQEMALARFRHDLAELARSTTRAGWLSGLHGAAMTASAYALLALWIGVGTFLALRNQLSVGSLIAAFELLWFMASAVAQLSGVVPPFQQAAAGLQRTHDLLAEEPEVVDAPGARPLPPLGEAIRFREVAFRYGDAEPTLKAVSVTIPAGWSVAIVGASGSGKSTMLSLLMRFHDPTSGSVTFDGHDLRHVTQASLRAQIGAVFQESFLFNTTIRENIRLGRPDATDEEVESAAAAAEIHDFILTLPQGYETQVGERGGRLSGGQRQRIALSRAILRRPGLLVLDEATSSLDVETEAAINATLERVARSRTAVSVTHRLASVVKADHILVLERGHVVEHGSHAELLQRKGAYYRAWQRQQGFVISADGRHAQVEPARLRAIPVFANLTEPQLAAVADRFISEYYRQGETLFEEGDEGETLQILVRGRVEVLKRGADGPARQVAVLEDGDFFGEIALLENVPRTATIRTRTASLLLTLDREGFRNLLQAAPELRTVFERVAEARRKELAALP
jgi:ATP-binding cassette subfamily B protein